jgi:hypothetical protein
VKENKWQEADNFAILAGLPFGLFISQFWPFFKYLREENNLAIWHIFVSRKIITLQVFFPIIGSKYIYKIYLIYFDKFSKQQKTFCRFWIFWDLATLNLSSRTMRGYDKAASQ